jgi:hypothetical protein
MTTNRTLPSRSARSGVGERDAQQINEPRHLHCAPADRDVDRGACEVGKAMGVRGASSRRTRSGAADAARTVSVASARSSGRMTRSSVPSSLRINGQPYSAPATPPPQPPAGRPRFDLLMLYKKQPICRQFVEMGRPGIEPGTLGLRGPRRRPDTRILGQFDALNLAYTQEIRLVWYPKRYPGPTWYPGGTHVINWRFTPERSPSRER